jgi:hypothetical protein
MDVGLSYQHWLSPQVEIRPEIAYYRSLDNPAFNTDCNAGICAGPAGTPGVRDWAIVAASDLIWHF